MALISSVSGSFPVSFHKEEAVSIPKAEVLTGQGQEIKGSKPPSIAKVETAAKSSLQKISHSFKRSPFGKFIHSNKNLAFIVGSVIKTTVNTVKTAVSFADNVISGARNVANALKGFWDEASLVAKAVRFSQLFVGFLAPFSLAGLGFGIHKMVTGNSDEKVDAAIEMTQEVSTLAETTAVFAKGLSVAGVVAESSVAWAGPLAIVGAALSVANVIANIRGWVQSHQVLNEFLEKMGGRKPHYAEEDYKKALEFLKSKEENFLTKHFKADGKKLKGQIGTIITETGKQISSKNEDEVKKGKETLRKTVECLKDRLRAKKISNILGGVASTVSIIGTAILFLSPLFAPIAPLGFALLATGAAIMIAKFLIDWRSGKRFEERMVRYTAKANQKSETQATSAQVARAEQLRLDPIYHEHRRRQALAIVS